MDYPVGRFDTAFTSRAGIRRRLPLGARSTTWQCRALRDQRAPRPRPSSSHKGTHQRARTHKHLSHTHTHTCYHAHRPARKPRPSACSEGLRHSTDATCFAPITTHQARLIPCRVMLLGSASLMARGGIACCATPQLDNIAYTRIPCQPRHCCHNFALLKHLTPHSMHRLPR